MWGHHQASLTPEAAKALGIEPLSATASLKSQHASKRAAAKELRVRVKAALSLKAARGRYAAGHERVRNYHEPDNRVTDASGERWTWKETVGKGSLTRCIEGRRRALATAAAALR